MQYLLLIYSDESEEMKATPEQIAQTMVAYRAYTEALMKAGAHVASDRLKPIATATTVHMANGKTEVLNGPYAETREQLGGYYQIEAADLDEALAWAARCPSAAYGHIEVRPIWSMTSKAA